jgi:L-lysine 6-transaminase
VPDSSELSGDELERAERESLDSARRFFTERPGKIACVLAEPIQGEGGDRHMRPEFLRALEALAHENDALFVLDEVQTGCGMTGRNWCYQKLGLKPDIVAFAKKIQVGGFMAGRRLLEESENVFSVPGRISSTWGGGLVDMVRSTLILKEIESENLVENAAAMGDLLLESVSAATAGTVASRVRGSGLMVAFDMPDRAQRDAVHGYLEDSEHLLVLRCGERSIRLRPPLNVKKEEISKASDAIGRGVRHVQGEYLQAR